LNIDYFRDLSTESYEELIFIMKTETFQAGHHVFQQNKYYNKIFILVNGDIELFFALKNKDIPVETISSRGCVLN